VTTFVYDALNRLSSEQFTQNGSGPLRIDLAYNAGTDEVSSMTRYHDLAGTPAGAKWCVGE